MRCFDSGYCADCLKTVSSPVTREDKPEISQDKEDDINRRKRLRILSAKHVAEGAPLEVKGLIRFRVLAARAIFLGIDRPAILFTGKELTRSMAAPTQGDYQKVVRRAQY